MLTYLSIQNFIIIEKITLDFREGLTVITGETGAGKSIIIDALGLILGARADTGIIGQFHDKCDLAAFFDVKLVPEAIKWLQRHEFAHDTDCLIRRILHKDGKTKQMINGYPCTLQQLKQFIQLIMTTHSQHQYQKLGKSLQQRELLDLFDDNPTLINQVNFHFQQWFQGNEKLKELHKLQQNFDLQHGLLEYQISEFEKFNIQPDEYEQLDHEQKQLANAEQLLKNCYDTLSPLSGPTAPCGQDLLYQALNNLQPIAHHDIKIHSTSELLNNSIMHLEEAISELKGYMNKIEINPQRLHEVESRLSKIHELARKYRVCPQSLLNTFNQLREELTNLRQVNQQVQMLTGQVAQFKINYLSIAEKLFKSRLSTAEKLNKVITEYIRKLGMPGGHFQAQVQWNDQIPTPYGCDRVDFLVSTNPGQPLQPLNKVASGGEMSRIALAIYVATAQKNITSTVVFDEVDVGIGGGTAAIVGNLLKSLGKKTQVLCITHLPQVAAYGDHHIGVFKKLSENSSLTEIKELSDKERVQEIARMLGGITITEKTLAHAKELMLIE